MIINLLNPSGYDMGCDFSKVQFPVQVNASPSIYTTFPVVPYTEFARIGVEGPIATTNPEWVKGDPGWHIATDSYEIVEG